MTSAAPGRSLSNPMLAPAGPSAAARPGGARLPGVVGERVRRVTLAAIGLLVVLNGADVVTTRLLLAHRAAEANPLSSLLLAGQSLLWVKLAILAVLGLKIIRSRPRLGIMGVACFAAGIYATAVLSNLLVLHLAAS